MTSLEGCLKHFILDSDSLRTGQTPDVEAGQPHITLSPVFALSLYQHRSIANITLTQLTFYIVGRRLAQSSYTFWASQPSFTLSTPLLAIASSHGLLWFDILNLHPSHGSGYNSTRTNETLSVAWTSPQVIAGGCRNGSMILADTRIREGGRLSKSMRLQHSTSIMRLKRVDEWRLLCAGPNKARTDFFFCFCLF